MASTGVNVLRYSALGAGVLYGFLHQSKLSSAAKQSAINKKYEHQEALIAKAKAEYAKKNLPPNSVSSQSDVTTANSTTAYFSTATATATITPTSMLPTDLSKFGSPESSWTFLSGINLSRHFRS